MNISPVKFDDVSTNKTSFGHGNPWADSPYSVKERTIIAGTTALGVVGSLAILAKSAKYSLNPAKMFKNFKGSYIHKAPYDEKEIITIGAGSCLGGLAGGYIVDKNPDNRKAKLRETLMQIANISIPIIFVVRFAKGAKYLGQKFFEKNKNVENARTKVYKATGAIAGIFAGVFVSNVIANKINELIFKKGKGRPVQLSDFSAHLDDFCMAARQIDETNPLIHKVTMCIPLALMVAGNEVGNKTLHEYSREKRR